MMFLAVAGGLESMLISVLPLVAMMGVMYFILMRPEKKRRDAYRTMLSSLAVNDEIVTKGGIVGKIINLDDDYMVLQTGPDRVRLRLVRDSVFSKVTKQAEQTVTRE